MFSNKGQASFEMLLLVVVIIILAANVLVVGISDFSEIGVLAYVHNSFANYKVSNNYSGKINTIDINAKGDKINIDVVVNELPQNIDLTKQNIENNIKNNTRYNIVSVNFVTR